MYGFILHFALLIAFYSVDGANDSSLAIPASKRRFIEGPITGLIFPEYSDWAKRVGDTVKWPCGLNLTQGGSPYHILDAYWSVMINQTFIRINKLAPHITVTTVHTENEWKRILTIGGVKTTDPIEYRCTIELGHGNIENDIRLRLRPRFNRAEYPPYLTTDDATPSTREEGESIQLRCGVKTSGFPSPFERTEGMTPADIKDVLWMVPGTGIHLKRIETSDRIRKITQKDRDGFHEILSISNLQISDAEIPYYCIVLTKKGMLSYAVNFQVVPKLELAFAFNSLLPAPLQRDFRKREGESVEWSCGVDRSYSITSLVDDVFWTRQEIHDGRTISRLPVRLGNAGNRSITTVRNSKEFRSTLTMRNLHPLDTSRYICNVQFITRTISTEFKLRVI